MSSTNAPHGAPVAIERLLSRNGLIVGICLAAAAVLAWLWLASSPTAMASMGGHGMPSMAVQPWSASYLLPAFIMWTLMMVAMMLPSAAPMILLHARIDRSASSRLRLLNTFVFALAYLLLWTLFSAAAAIVQALLVDAGLVSAVELTLGSRAVAAGLLVTAAGYQLSAAKRVCLDQCRSPLSFILRLWRPGTAGAIRLGLAHGVYCLGCCWALMLLLFVGGVMNLAWVAVLALVVFAEKLAPPSWHANRVIAAALLLGAFALLIGQF